MKKILIAFMVLSAIFVLSQTYTINFKVYDSKTFQPIAGAKVYVGDELIGETDENGILTHSFEVGDYEIRVVAEGYNPETRTITVIIDSDEEFYLVPEGKTEKKLFKNYRRKYAILVGVSETADPNIPKLRFADSDVDLIKSILTSYFAIPEENIFVLKSHPDLDRGEKKSNKNVFLGILKKISEMSLTQDDLLVIYMSTHGETVPDEDGDEPDGYDEVFAMSDSQLGMMTTFLIDDELAKYLEMIDAKKVLIFDACYIAGRKSMSIKLEEEEGEDDLERTSDVLITSSSPGAASYESEELRSSLFASAFLRTIEDYRDLDENSDGFVDSHEFFKALKMNLENLSQKLMGFVQSPTMSERNVVALFNVKEGYLKVNVKPKGVEIYVDGEKIEIEGEGIVLKVGYHSLKVEKKGYETYEKTVKVNPGWNELKVELVRKGGWIVGKVIDADSKKPVRGAEVLVIGSDKKVMTDEGGEFELLLPAGAYNGIVVKKEGYKVAKIDEKIVISPGKKVKKLISLEKERTEKSEFDTTLSVSSNIVGAKVFLNERFIGKTPIENFPIYPGNYKLKAVSDAGEVIEKNLTIPKGRSVAIFLEFSKVETSEKVKPKRPEILKTFTLTITTYPSGASVRMKSDSGERFLGTTPLTVDLDEGWYSFEIEKEGYKKVVIDEDYYLAGDDVRLGLCQNGMRI